MYGLGCFRMIINDINYKIGNTAMASVLLLYYHLLNEGGITNDQTVYLDPKDFDGFKFLGVEVKSSSSISLDLDEKLIREGAVIYILCDLNDIVCEFEDFQSQPEIHKYIEVLKRHADSPIVEVSLLLKHISMPEKEFNYSKYNEVLQGIYKKYVYEFFVNKLLKEK